MLVVVQCLFEFALKVLTSQVLQKGDNGFFLVVEGGKIDLAHHDVQVKLYLNFTT